MEKSFVFKNADETRAFGRELAKELSPGSVVALTGDLGAGKTTLSQAIAEGLGVKERLQSPSFTLIREYDDGRLPLYHFDVYRVSDEEELFEIGFDEYLNGRGVCLIEWADLIKDLLPENTVWISLRYGETENERICERR